MIDVAKIAEGIGRPGIDPRKFVELAVVTAVRVDDLGVHCDVETISGIPETVEYSPPYGGGGYGFHSPIAEGDWVVLAVPDGKFNAGARIIGRTWDPGYPPPSEVVDNPDDVCLVVRPGQTIRIIVSGGGNAVIEARDDGKVALGNEDASDPALTGADGRDFLAALAQAIATAPTTGVQALTALLSALQSLPPTTLTHSGKLWPVGAERVLVK